MTIFSCNNLSKTYNDVLLFEHISFGMEEGERIGLIGRNGVGKTTFLRIIGSKEYPDEGTVAFNNQMRFEYLEQIPSFNRNATVLETVMDARPQVRDLLMEHTLLCAAIAKDHTEANEKKLEEITHKIEIQNGWTIETEAKIILQKLGMDRFNDNVDTMSGGQRKRVALARVLLSDPDLLILDEPTNHLDADSVQWLQDRLQNSAKALLLVTHDRYFLDAVSNKIVELDQRKIFSYPGSYEHYLELKEIAVTTQEAADEHTRNKLRNELAWLQKGAKARRTKQKSRIDWIAKIQAEGPPVEHRNIKIELGKQFLGGRIIDAVNLSKSIGGKLLFKDFTYTAAPGDRIGIIGPNGTGKSTLLRVLAGELPPDTGWVNIGTTVKIGFFRQEITDLKDTQTVIGSLREIAEFIDTGVGRERFITAKELLDRFLFPSKQHHAQIQTLSGGERRRLGLLRVLMGNPNVLFLDEPTNDFDINTLSALEEYLQNFLGCLLIVSHDRAFLDRAVEHIYAFEEHGVIKPYPGNYSSYLTKKEEQEKIKAQQSKAIKEENAGRQERSKQSGKKKLTYHQQKEYEALEKEIAKIEAQKRSIEELLGSGGDYKLLAEKATELAALELKLEEAMLRWMELGEIAEG